MNGMGFLQQIVKPNSQPDAREKKQCAKIDLDAPIIEAPTNDNELLTVGEMRKLLHGLEVTLRRFISIENSDEMARQIQRLKRELVPELLGAMDARDNFKEYEKQKTLPEDEEDFLAQMRRLYGQPKT